MLIVLFLLKLGIIPTLERGCKFKYFFSISTPTNNNSYAINRRIIYVIVQLPIVYDHENPRFRCAQRYDFLV